MTERGVPRTVAFGPLQVEHDDTVLVPRPWTLEQSRWAAALLPDAPAGPVLEVCAGVGHIGLVAVAGSGRSLVLVDADAHACELARRNAAQVDEPVEVRHGPMDEVVGPDERFAAVLADPPWVPSDGVAAHPDDPEWAIDGGADGLDVARTCVRLVGRVLLPGGGAVLQLGAADQALALQDDLDAAGLATVRVHQADRGALVLLERTPA
ncbi:MAG: methyltransferase [Aeromicrobium erythreum]